VAIFKPKRKRKTKKMSSQLDDLLSLLANFGVKVSFEGSKGTHGKELIEAGFQQALKQYPEMGKILSNLLPHHHCCNSLSVKMEPYFENELKSIDKQISQVKEEIEKFGDKLNNLEKERTNVLSDLQKTRERYIIECSTFLKLTYPNVDLTNLGGDLMIITAHHYHFIEINKSLLPWVKDTMTRSEFVALLDKSPLLDIYLKCQEYNPDKFTIYSKKLTF
jgi:archaellum component FlaC